MLVLGTVYVVLLLDKTEQPWIRRVLQWMPAILFAYILPALITHIFHLDLSGVPLHAWNIQFVMPMAIVLVMSALSFRQLRAVGWRPILVFLSGSAAVALGPFLLLPLLGIFSDEFHHYLIDMQYWKGMVTMVGSWIGGSTSMLILKELSGCSEPLFLIILVMDNVLVNLWTLLMFQKIKRSEAINRFFGINDRFTDYVPDKVSLNTYQLKSGLASLGICLVLVAGCYFFIPSFLLKVVLLSLMGLALGNFLRFWNHSMVLKAGGYLIITIMAILGLRLNLENFNLPGMIILFAIGWLVFHYLVMMVVARGLKLNMAWVPIASMANVGGISTAPAVTKAYNEEWMPHAILLAILSMVTGTYWGMLSIYLFKTLY
jgi:uncharacterized membrane protein